MNGTNMIPRKTSIPIASVLRKLASLQAWLTLAIFSAAASAAAGSMGAEQKRQLGAEASIVCLHAGHSKTPVLLLDEERLRPFATFFQSFLPIPYSPSSPSQPRVLSSWRWSSAQTLPVNSSRALPSLADF